MTAEWAYLPTYTMEKKKYSIEIGGKALTAEVSSLAEQANAAVVVQYGDTVILATAVMGKEDKPLDYMPLKVDYEERFYAAGKILGSRFMRREGRPSEDAILTGRLVDRTIRPLFDRRMRRDVQVVVTVLAYDEQQSPDFIAVFGASLALAMSDIPWAGPVAAVRVAQMEGQLLTNPGNAELAGKETFETFASGPKGRINMIELAGKEAKESDILPAYQLAQKEIDRLVEFQETIAKEVGKPKAAVKLMEGDPEFETAVKAFLSEEKLARAVYPHLHPEHRAYALDKVEREHRTRELQKELLAHLEATYAGNAEMLSNMKAVGLMLDDVIDEFVHKNVIEKDLRPDGRKLDEVRPLAAEVGLFTRTHGSAVFMRGNTQALAITTLAPPGQEQLMESMETSGKRRFLLHYNFPPYSVGETGMFRGPGRREIGHGALAYKAVEPLIPTAEVFPYTIRVVSEILSSNGSSSMATVCATSLSLMDAGVPLPRPVAGIAMGLMAEPSTSRGHADKYKILTDIQGPEDHYGDMDFKVAGTRDGVTAIQLDVKNDGLTYEMIEKTLAQANKARMHILGVMEGVLAAPRASISPLAPTVLRTKIDPEKIGLVIGPGGKTINGMIAHFELAGIDVEEDGNVFVSAMDPEKARSAVKEIEALTHEWQVGDMVEGEIIKILDFGAIVDLGGGLDGMIHVSELRDGFVKSVSDVVKLGDFVRAKIIRVEDGRIGLSLKQAGPAQD